MAVININTADTLGNKTKNNAFNWNLAVATSQVQTGTHSHFFNVTWKKYLLSFWLALSLLCDIGYVTMIEKFSWELLHCFVTHVTHKAMITPVNPLRTRLIHISPSYWTTVLFVWNYSRMGTVRWIGIQSHCSMQPIASKKYSIWYELYI